jgi:hypothetical protein
VGLGLSMETGMVSPTFHAKYDDNSVTVQKKISYVPKSQWHVKRGFISSGESRLW